MHDNDAAARELQPSIQAVYLVGVRELRCLHDDPDAARANRNIYVRWLADEVLVLDAVNRIRVEPGFLKLATVTN